MMEKDKKNKIKVYILGACLVVILIGIGFYFWLKSIENTLDEMDNYDKGEQEVNEDKPPYDFTVPPTYLEVRDTMDKIVEGLYGQEFYDYVEENDVIKIPDTQIYFNSYEVSDPIELMGVHIMSMTRNPYAFMENEDTVRELPDGTEIDLGALVEEYTQLQFSVDRNNPCYMVIQGYSNGDWFEEYVDLSSLYSQYY